MKREFRVEGSGAQLTLWHHLKKLLQHLLLLGNPTFLYQNILANPVLGHKTPILSCSVAQWEKAYTFLR